MEFLAAHWLDIVTTVLGLAYILFEYRASVWMWVVGFLMQSLGIVLYYQKELYADCGMEFYYLAMTVYGWWKWQTLSQPLPKGRGEDTPTMDHQQQGNNTPPSQGGVGGGSARAIRHFPRRLIFPWLLLIAVIWGIIFWLLVTFTDSNVPLADSFTTALSIVGIWALAHKYLEQWFIWIAIDVVTSVLYFYKDIPFKGSLYALYIIIAILGYRKWKRMMKAENTY